MSELVPVMLMVIVKFAVGVMDVSEMVVDEQAELGAGKHKMLSKLATQSFNILRLIARNPNFWRPKVPYFNVSRLSRLQMAQKWPKMTPNGPKWAKYDPKWPQMALE